MVGEQPGGGYDDVKVSAFLDVGSMSIDKLEYGASFHQRT